MVSEQTNERILDAKLITLGYLFEQGLTTFNVSFKKTFDYLCTNYGKEYCSPDADDISDQEQEYSDENFQIAGFFAGSVQDIACVIGASAYCFGSDSKLAAIAATITGVKVITNTASLVGYGMYRVLNPRPRNYLENED